MVLLFLNAMKKRSVILLAVVAVLLLQGCSRKGVYMPRNRKARHCNTCPTFSLNAEAAADGNTVARQ